MLLPQFSLRLLLAGTSVLAVVSLVIARAVNGAHWAVGVSFGVATLAMGLVIYGLLFFLLWLFSLVLSRRRERQAQAKAATTPLPPVTSGA